MSIMHNLNIILKMITISFSLLDDLTATRYSLRAYSNILSLLYSTREVSGDREKGRILSHEAICK